MKYRAEELGYEEEFRGLGLTSRKNLCLHPSVRREKSGTVVDARCRSLTAGFVKEKKERGEDVALCVYHDNLDLLEPHDLIPNGVWTLDGLMKYGEEHKQCPYFTSRRMVSTHGKVAWNCVNHWLDVLLQRHHLLLSLSLGPKDR